ncbi:hypothetical protein KCU73_g7019, partial [Aureobasidium melanogenum]
MMRYDATLHLFDYSASQYCGQHESDNHYHSRLFFYANPDLDGHSYSDCHIDREPKPNNNTNSDPDANTDQHNDSLCHYHGSSSASKHSDNYLYLVSRDATTGHIHSLHNHNSNVNGYNNCYVNSAQYTIRSYTGACDFYSISSYSLTCNEHTDTDCNHDCDKCSDTDICHYRSSSSCKHFNNDIYASVYHDADSYDYCSSTSSKYCNNHIHVISSSTSARHIYSIHNYDSDIDRYYLSTVYAATPAPVVNGVLGFGITNSYSPSSLPQYSALSPSGYALMPFWADLYIYQGTAQGIYYEVDGTSPSRILTFEYYASYYQQSNNYYHFQVLFYENNTGSFTFKYLNITDSGANAVVGYQCQPKSKYKQYSSKQAIITNGLRIDYTYSNDTFTSSQVVAASRATVLSPVIEFMSRIAGKVSDTWRSATGWLRGHPTNTTTLAAFRKMSSPEQSSTEKKNDKTRETCRRGPEDGYPFIVDEVFKQRGPEPIPEPVTVRRVSRPAGPHRTSKKAAVVESESSAVRVGEVAPGSTSIQVSSMQTPANNPFAVSNAGSQPSSRISEITRGQHRIKDTSRPIESAARPASLHTTMPGVYAESDDGGVELPEHIDSEINHDAARRVEAGSG